MQFTKINKPAVQETPKEHEEEKPVSAADVLKILQEQGASRSQEDHARLLEAVALLAKNITHPPPTDEQVQVRLKLWPSVCSKRKSTTHRRHTSDKHCVPRPDPNLPQSSPARSRAIFWKVRLAWHFSTPTVKTVTGSADGPLTAFGMCPWCATDTGNPVTRLRGTLYRWRIRPPMEVTQ